MRYLIQMKYPDIHHAGVSVDLVLLTMSMGCGGTERVVSRLCDSFASRRCTLAVVSISDQGEDFFKLPSRVMRLRMGSASTARGKWVKMFTYMRLIRRLRVTLRELDAKQAVSFLPVPNVLLVLSSIGLPVKTIVCERNNPYLQQDLNSAWKLLRRFCYPLADKITVNSEAAEEFCKTFRKRTDVIRISNPPVWNSEPVDALANRVILYVGRIVYQKGIDLLLDAVLQVDLRKRGWTLVLVGDGNEKARLRAKSREMGLDDLIFWKDPTPQIMKEYRDAAFVVLPSRFEGTSNSMLEALAMGLPVVTSLAGAGDVVKDDVNGIVLQELSVENLANALERMVSDSDLRKKLTLSCISQIDRGVSKKKISERESLFELPATSQGK